MSQWKELITISVIEAHRTGWLGVWDALYAAIFKETRITVNRPITFSAWVRCVQETKLSITQAQIETGRL